MTQQRSFYPDEECSLILDAIPKGKRNQWINEAIVLASQHGSTKVDPLADVMDIAVDLNKRLTKLEKMAERQGANW
jgi:hypothetical protein